MIRDDSRRGRPKKARQSKLAAVLAYSERPPKNWHLLTARERKERVCKTVGVNAPYLQQLIAKNERLKDFFGIVRRRRRPNRRLRPHELARQATALELEDLVTLSKTVRLEIKRRVDMAKAEIDG